MPAFGVPEKREWLADRCEAILADHRGAVGTLFGVDMPRPIIERSYRRALDYASSRSERIHVMGDPCWYLCVLEIGPTRPTHKGRELTYEGGIHTFELVLYLQYKDGVYDESSQAVWDQMVEGVCLPADPNPRSYGLLMKLRRTGYSRYMGRVLQVTNVLEDQKGIVALDREGDEAAHMLYAIVEVDDGAN